MKTIRINNQSLNAATIAKKSRAQFLEFGRTRYFLGEKNQDERLNKAYDEACKLMGVKQEIPEKPTAKAK